jgi:NADP-dependent 3-hydroxy acid dehydrogenase YdfG
MAQERHDERREFHDERRGFHDERHGFGFQDLRSEEKEKRKNETILITGASSGIGKECLKFFAREGYHCVGLDLAFENEAEFKKSLSLDLKDDNICLENCDVSIYEQFRAVVEKCERKSGSINCLINAACTKDAHYFEKQDILQWKKMFDINVLGVLNGVRCVVDKMKENKIGCIINIGEVSDQKTFKHHTVYCASKAALRGITEGLRYELLEHQIKVVGVNPGAVETESFAKTQDKDVESHIREWKDKMKHGLLQSQDVARACLFAYQQPKRCLIREIQLASVDQKK